MQNTQSRDSQALRDSLRAKLGEKRSQRSRGGGRETKQDANAAAQDALFKLAGDNAAAMSMVCSVLKDGKLSNPYGPMKSSWGDEE